MITNTLGGQRMYAEHHDLINEFPEYSDKIHTLKGSNAHFAKLFDAYHEVDKEVRHIEQALETPSDEYTEEVKKRRLSIKDQLFDMLKA